MLEKKQKWKLLSICITLSLAANFQFGFSTTYLNTSVAKFRIYLNESLADRGIEMDESLYTWIWSAILNVWFVGYIIGLVCSSQITDRYGRKAGFMAGAILNLLAAVLRTGGIMFKWPEMFFIGRAICAFASALSYSALVLYLQEISPTELRGQMSFTSGIVYSLMCLLGMALGTETLLGRDLRLLLGFAIIPSVLAVLVLLPLPETPKFLLLARKDRKRSMHSLQLFHGKLSTADLDFQLKAIEMEVEDDRSIGDGEKKAATSIREIFATPHLRRAVVFACLALQLTVPQWPIFMLSTSFLRRVHISEQLAEMSSTLIMVTYSIGSIIGYLTVERFPRRMLLLGFSSINEVCLILFAAFAALESIVGLMRYGCLVTLIVFGFAYGFVAPLCFFMAAELVPLRHRSRVQSICYLFDSFNSIAVSFATLPVYNVLNAYTFLPLFVAPSIAIIIYLYKYLPETKGREIFTIVEQLKQKDLKTTVRQRKHATTPISTVHNLKMMMTVSDENECTDQK